MITFRMKIGNQSLSKYSADVQRKMPGIVKENAMAIQANAAKNAPVLTGALMGSILAEQDTELRWEVHDGVEYGAAQELGTSKGISAKHFLGNACEVQADKFFKEIMEALKG